MHENNFARFAAIERLQNTFIDFEWTLNLPRQPVLYPIAMRKGGRGAWEWLQRECKIDNIYSYFTCTQLRIYTANFNSHTEREAKCEQMKTFTITFNSFSCWFVDTRFIFINCFFFFYLSLGTGELRLIRLYCSHRTQTTIWQSGLRVAMKKSEVLYCLPMF